MKIWKLAALVVASTMAFAGCTKKTKSSYGLDVNETLRIHVNSEPPTLDWHKSTDTTSSLITTNLMEGLTAFDFSTGEVKTKPALASEWSSNKNNTVWTFTLKKGVLWSDGVELTAQHFVDGWQRLLDPKTASEYSYYLYNLKNAKAYSEGKVKDFSKVGVKTNDKGQLVVTLEKPQSFFPSILNHSATFPVRKDVVAKHGDKWTSPGNIVTLGAFSLKKWEHDKALVLERSETYHGEKAKTKYILGRIIPETSTALSLFKKGELDAMDTIPTLEIPKLSKTDEYVATPVFTTYYLGFNVNKAPMNDAKVRQAISLAINKKEITDLVNGGQIPLNAWLPKGMLGYDENIGLAYNPEKARQLLAQAGYPEGKGFPKVHYGFNTFEAHQRIAENIQQQLKRNLGISAELKNEEWKVYLKTLNVDPYQIYRLGWVADFADPDNFMGMMLSYSENNRSQWVNKKYDRLVEKALTIKDTAERKKIYLQAQKILLEEEAAVIPIYSAVNNALVSKEVKNYPKNAMSTYNYKATEVVR